MAEDVYLKLREFLDTLPFGYPQADGGLELKILKKLFQPEDAELVMNMTIEPEPASVIARRYGMVEFEVAERLESMAKRGLVFRVREGEMVLYKACQFIVGIYEHQLPWMDREFAEMVEEYIPYFGLNWAMIDTKQMRIIPVNSSVEASPSIASYDSIRELMKQQDIISLQECICTKQQELLGEECAKPIEACFGFGDLAQYYIDNEMGRKIATEEALELLDEVEEVGRVLQPNNSQEISWVCSCCECCCGILKTMKLMPNPADLLVSTYRSSVDSDLCTACGICQERCPMDAIDEDGEYMVVNPARCIGCGLCVSSCLEDAISLKEKTDAKIPPESEKEKLHRMIEERSHI